MEADSGLNIFTQSGWRHGSQRLVDAIPADILNVPVVRPIVAETTALGAAYAAGLATGFGIACKICAPIGAKTMSGRPKWMPPNARDCTANGRKQSTAPWDGSITMSSKPRAVIIGAGFTGCAIAYDLAQRGFNVDVLERGDIASGTSGRTHGLLHSGGRYCVTDQEAAIECIQENRILMQIAKQCIESNGGLFVALTENDLAYGDRFERGAQVCGIPIEKLSPREILKREPNLNPGILGGYSVPDAVFDPLRLAMAFAASAIQYGARFNTFMEVTGILHNGQGRASAVKARERHSGEERSFPADLVINATGAWAGIVAKLAGVHVPVKPTPGVMVAYDQRVTQRVINRLCEPMTAISSYRSAAWRLLVQLLSKSKIRIISLSLASR